MTIKIKENEGMELKFWVPNSMIKSHFILRLIKKHCHDESVNKYLPLLPTLYNSLKKYIKENGHFILVDITSNSGDKVYIKV